MLRCPTSEFPIWPSGKPTALPEASSVVQAIWRKRRSSSGVSACAMAFHSRSLRQPKPSRTIRMRKGWAGGTAADDNRESKDVGMLGCQIVPPIQHPNILTSLLRLRSLFPFEHHADVIGCAGFEIDRGDADQFPTFIAQAVELLSAARIHRVILRPDVDDLVFPGLHVRPLPRC